ncbi:uncharacterized protein involved in response to NO [Rhodobium orientis]|nr:NnrS family protein [Rhodobium orientis]MBB4305313.1 uncharacterized protein involved in response to NO [Rhodobium orientis]
MPDETAPLRTDALPIVFRGGFRVFFLLAGLFALAAIGAWLAWLAIHALNGMVPEPTIAVAPHLWHGHEMLFGYAGATLAGFLTTAVPSWTGQPGTKPRTLLLLSGLWLAGRIAVWFSALVPAAIVAGIDLLFFPALTLWLAMMLAHDPKPRNLLFLVLTTGLFLANLMVHLEWTGLADSGAELGIRAGIALISVKIAIVGGRVTPAFTRNSLIRAGKGDRLPVVTPRLGQAAITAGLLFALLIALDAPPLWSGIAAAAAAAFNAGRLAGWRGTRALHDPLTWSLHLAFLLLVVGYGAIAASLLFDAVDEIAAWHFLGIGALGLMSLAIMTRIALGHTGRQLAAAPVIALAYVAIALAAVTRTFGPAVLPDDYYTPIFVAGGLWMFGFALFALIYFPILTRPRVLPATAHAQHNSP